ncbi:Anaphase-promoting complex subunit 2 [Coemansia sp. RSA 1821]|nr:Anaphase-promoting complex subunit 2 [Coemansia sp. RSA 1086]KAJ1749117.1 Anaphase-promoting complex subunit 2 [Coemansia sp. RSA 1821]
MYNVCDVVSDNALSALVQQVKAHVKNGSSGVGFAVHNDNSLDQLSSSCMRHLLELRSKTEKPFTTATMFDSMLSYLQDISTIQHDFEQHAMPVASKANAQMAWNALICRMFDDATMQQVQEWLYISLYCLSRLIKTHSSEMGHLLQGFTELTNYEDDASCEDTESDVFAIYEQISRDSNAMSSFVSAFIHSCKLLVEIRALAYLQITIKQAVDRIIEDKVQSHAQQWEVPCLEAICAEMSNIATMLDALLPPPTQSHLKYVEDQVYTQFAQLRVHELFGIIIDYPDSKAAIDDLRLCVQRHRSMYKIAYSLRASIQERLLHPGATTSDILTQYISAIRCLRLLDPSSTMLEIVARPIREYLRTRDNTVSCIVQDMVSEESGLFEDMANQTSDTSAVNGRAEGVVFDEDCSQPWEPLPVEAKTIYKTAQRRDADVLSLLVSIYDTQDIFVDEFEAYLAKQLLNSVDFDTEREIKQVEMMKLRFGAEALERCEVMLKDVADSKRIWHNANTNEADNAYSTLVISRQFWQQQQQQTATNEQFVLPPQMSYVRDRFAKTFEALRPARKLDWRDSQSLLDICIEVQGRSIKVNDVRPAQAAVLFAFQETPRMSLHEVAQVMESSEDFVLPRVRFWQTRGVLREAGNVFETVEVSPDDVADDNRAQDMVSNSDEEEEEEAGPPEADAQSEALRMHFNYIVGMLTNFGPLPLDRIHSMLGMFIPGDTTTPDELRAFLTQMVREDQLDMSGGMYKLK